MNAAFAFSADEVAPARQSVFELQGITTSAAVSDRVDALYAEALGLYQATVDAQGLVAAITKDEFETIYEGEGRNDSPAPVADIFPHADQLALFAVTLGPRISMEIGDRFRANDLALASMLDSVASAAADRTADVLQHHYAESLRRKLADTPESSADRKNRHAALRYSPGYCGWHVSGQRKLFDCLRPERIGLSLRSSFLMDPLKSISGVLIAGPKEIHEFPDNYDFCSRCDNRGCRERIRTLCENEYVVES